MKKNAFTLVELLAIVIIMASILLVVLPSINDAIKSGEENKKQDNLNSIYMAAENYLMSNYDKYSSLDDIGASEYIYITDLIANNYISISTVNPITDSYFKNSDAVKVTRNNDGTFSYELVYFKTLIETLLEQYADANKTGLVKDNTNPNLYYYTGTNEQVNNNFLWYGGHQWRVLDFDTSAKTLTLITQQPLTAIHPASSVWTTEKSYASSYINSWLNDYFLNSLDSDIQNNILDNTFNVGIYTNVDEITTIQKVGLLDENQYKRTGGNNSFLNINDYWWLGNRYNSSTISSVDGYGNLNYVSISSKYGIRPVIKIYDMPINGGDGTIIDSYYSADKATNTNGVQVGEYINVPYSGDDNACGDDNLCSFKVVSKDNDSIKAILNGLLPSTSAWADSASDNITTNDLVYTSLNNFVAGISSTYRYIGNKTFYVGDYPNAANYKDVQDATLEANVGLPTVGEIFSGNDIDVSSSSTKFFVDANTIENNSSSKFYWTMNRYSPSEIRCVADTGSLNSYSSTELYGVRPVIYLKLGLVFVGGEGTAQDPYRFQ